MEDRYDSIISDRKEIEVTDNIERAYSAVKMPDKFPEKMLVCVGDKRYIFANETNISRFYDRITQSNSDITLQNAVLLADRFMSDPQSREISEFSPAKIKKLETHEGTQYTIVSKFQ